MSRIGVDKFKFVSPGVYLAEIDQSVRRGPGAEAGPVVIGRFEKGPTMVPTKVNNLNELIEVFGRPIPGREGGDVSRYGNRTAPSYAGYAAMAWLRNTDGITIVRLVGQQHKDAQASTSGIAGWSVGKAQAAGRAWGLFLAPSASVDSTVDVTGTLAAVFYVHDSGSVVLSGALNPSANAAKDEAHAANVLIKSEGDNARFKAVVLTNTGTVNDNTADQKATATIAVADGDDATTNQFSEGEYVKVIATDGTVGIFILSDASETGAVASGTVLEASSDLGTGTPSAALLAQGTCIAVRCNLNTNSQAVVLNEFKDTMDSANSPVKDKFTNSGNVAASNGPQTMTFTQATAGEGGNTTITTDISQFTVVSFTGGVSNTADHTVTFDFDPASDMFIRKVFNTNPIFTNTNCTSNSSNNYKRYWLGPTYEDDVQHMFTRGAGRDASGSVDQAHSASVAASGKVYGFMAPLGIAAGKNWADFDMPAQPAKSGWIFGQDLSIDYANYDVTAMPKLFRIASLEESDWPQKNLKISIANIKAPRDGVDAYGKFDLLVREINDTDWDMRVLEAYNGVNLNPVSENYIAARIGDQRRVWDDDERRYRFFGNFPNVSKLIRVEMDSDVDEGSTEKVLLPFGFYGMPRPAPVVLKADTAAETGTGHIGGGDNKNYSVGGDISSANWDSHANGAAVYFSDDTTFKSNYTASIEFPAHRFVQSASIANLPDPSDRFMGLVTSRSGTTAVFNESLLDINKARPSAFGSGSWDANTAAGFGEEVSAYFTLDDVRPPADGQATVGAVWIEGSRKVGKSFTAGSVALGSGSTVAPGFRKVLDEDYDKFTFPLYGGYEGVDVMEMEPIVNNALLDTRSTNAEKTVRKSYEFYTLRKSIDLVSDPEVVDMNLLAMPGMWDSAITDYMISTCENRADSLAIIDLSGAYTPRTETTESAAAANGAGTGNTVTSAVNEVKNTRKFNTSYGAAYYPWVKIRDNHNGMNLWTPPSVVAMGAMSYGQATQALWFAPAGFTRGGLSEGRGGFPVLQVSQRLTRKERDKLYAENINPIAQFPAEGIVIWGQKTLQRTPSALDRINVRRLVIFIKKTVSRIASRLLFSPNASQTWKRFVEQVKPFLASIKNGLGLQDFKVKLDATTTTPDLVDRNIMYAQIYIKPTLAIEFIAIDFIITNQGASFDD